MKSNLAVRLIIDSENNKAYLSIEGKVENATDQEKIKLRDTLTKALSEVIGIKTSSDNVETETINDFVPAPDETPDFVEQELEEKHKEVEPIIQESNENNKPSKKANREELLEEFKNKGKVELNFPAKYKGLTPYKVLAEYGDEGRKELESIIPVLEKNKTRFPKNVDAINEIQKALTEYAEFEKVSSANREQKVEKEVAADNFDKIVEEIKALGKETMIGIETICRSRGTTLQAIISSRDEAELKSIYETYRNLKKELEERKKK